MLSSAYLQGCFLPLLPIPFYRVHTNTYCPPVKISLLLNKLRLNVQVLLDVDIGLMANNNIRLCF